MKTIKEKRQILENIPRVTVDEINSSECRITYDVAIAKKKKIQEIADAVNAKDWGSFLSSFSCCEGSCNLFLLLKNNYYETSCIYSQSRKIQYTWS